MYFLRARYLNPTTGRFHTQDTYEGRNAEPLTLHKYLYAHADPALNTDPSGNVTLQEQSLVIEQETANVQLALDGVATAFRTGGSRAGGAALRQLGLQVERSVEAVLRNNKTVEILSNSGTRVIGPNGARVIDFLIKIENQIVRLEVKYKLPTRAGSALSRLVAQVEASVAQGGARTAVVNGVGP